MIAFAQAHEQVISEINIPMMPMELSRVSSWKKLWSTEAGEQFVYPAALDSQQIISTSGQIIIFRAWRSVEGMAGSMIAQIIFTITDLGWLKKHIYQMAKAPANIAQRQ